MRIGMVTQWYDPEGGSAVTFGVIARALHGLGHDVDVLTGFPNYPSGTLAEGYRLRPYLREVRDGVTVHRAPLYVSHDANAVHRAANYLSFGGSSAALAVKALGRSDVVLVVPSPPFAAGAGPLLKRLKGIPYGLQIQDLWPQSMTASGMASPGTAERIERVLNPGLDWLYRDAAFVAVTSPGMADAIGARGVPEEKLHFVSNWANEEWFHPVEAPADLGLPERRPFTVMYAGAMGDVQGLDVVLDAAERLRSRADIGFLLVGSGVAKARLEEEAQRRGLDNVAFAPPQPVTAMSDVLASAQVQLISLKDLPVFATTLPSKLPATLAAGRPIIGVVGGDAAGVIRSAAAGWVVAPGDGAGLAEAVAAAADLSPDALRERGHAGRRYYERELSQEVGVRRLESLLMEAAATGRRRAKTRRVDAAGLDAQEERDRVERVYTARGYDRDLEYADVNPVYLQRVQSMEAATLRALRAAGLWERLGDLDILDYGCGNGRWFGRWLAWGASPQRLAGVDIRPSAVAMAGESFPQCDVRALEDGAIPFGDASFDVVTMNLVLSSVLDDAIRARVAEDIRRVLRPGGVVVCCDFAIDNPRNPDVRALTTAQLQELFSGFEVVSSERLVLAPPLARRVVPLSRLAADVLEALPPLRTHRTVVLRKQ